MSASHLSLHVAVIGAGLMGHGIAQAFATAGTHVQIWDPDSASLATVTDRIRGNLTAMGRDPSSAPVAIAESIEDAVASADLVVEAIPERLELKQELLRTLDEVAPEAIVATNTSVLKVTAVAEGSRRPERVVGTHWWNPPYLIPIVEVVRGDLTEPAVADRVTKWLTAVGKVPVDVKWDAPGFIGNRMQFALYREALWIVEQGIADAETVDLVARNTFGARLAAVGPLENSDYIGLDLTAAILDYLSPHLSVEQSASPVLRARVASGKLGAKTGEGLFAWPDGQRDATTQRLMDHLLQSMPAAADHRR
jgi:3-hydroxybutyryl-CoA dehydrogenase